MREEKMNAAVFINTPLKRGLRMDAESENRFNGFAWPTETVETVSICPGAGNTLLKQGVNETWYLADLTI
jgi:hypothetical protein